MSEGFNKTVHYRDPKSGKVIAQDPYRLHITKQGLDSVRVFERGGVKYYENGDVVEQAPQVAEATLDSIVSKIEAEPVTAAPAKVASPVAQATVVIPPRAAAVGG